MSSVQGGFHPNLPRSGAFVASVDLGHEECFLAVPIAYYFSHAHFALAAVAVPAVVDEIQSFIEARADNPNAFLRIGLFAKMITAESNDGIWVVRSRRGRRDIFLPIFLVLAVYGCTSPPF